MLLFVSLSSIRKPCNNLQSIANENVDHLYAPYIMNDLDVEYFKQLILQQQQELIEMKHKSRKSSQPVNLDQSSVGRLSRMDAMQSQAMAQESKRRREIQLTRIGAALERIEEGEYGYCATCEEEIDRRRLTVDPANPFCVSCASKM